MFAKRLLYGAKLAPHRQHVTVASTTNSGILRGQSWPAIRMLGYSFNASRRTLLVKQGPSDSLRAPPYTS